jgi:hypothetical protein
MRKKRKGWLTIETTYKEKPQKENKMEIDGRRKNKCRKSTPGEYRHSKLR